MCVGDDCQVQKDVTCEKVCKLKDWGIADESTCSEAYCEGEHGNLACIEAGRTA